jgi:hypothetical protein
LEERKYSSTHPLASAVDGDEWSASRPGRFTPKERDPGFHWIMEEITVIVESKVSKPLTPKTDSRNSLELLQNLPSSDSISIKHC